MLLKHHDSLSVFPLNIPSRTEAVYALAQDKQGKEFQTRPLHRAHSCVWHLYPGKEVFKQPGAPNLLPYLQVQASEKQKQVLALRKSWLVNPKPGDLEGPEQGSSQLKQNHPPSLSPYQWLLLETTAYSPCHPKIAPRLCQQHSKDSAGCSQQMGEHPAQTGEHHTRQWSRTGIYTEWVRKGATYLFVTFTNRNKRLATWSCRLILTSASHWTDR